MSDMDRFIREYREAQNENARLAAERDAAQEHVAYHLRDYVRNGDLNGDLAVDMAAYAGRLKIRAEAAEAKVAHVDVLHVEAADGGHCRECQRIWPCPTRVALHG